MNAKTMMEMRDEFVGLNILEALDICELINVKIGADKGSSFFYIGEIANFRGHKGKMLAEKVEEDLKQILKKRYTEAKNTYNQTVRNYPTPAKYVQHQDESGWAFTYEGYQNVLKDYFKKVKRRQEIRDNTKWDLDDRKPFKERTVVSAYMSTEAEPKTIIFIIEGIEYGDYWTIEEYERGGQDAGKEE